MPKLTCIQAEIGGAHPPWIESNSVDVTITSPPYKLADGFGTETIYEMGILVMKALKPGGRFFLNFGQLREGFDRPSDVHQLVSCCLTPSQTIAWVKSIAVPGVGNQLKTYLASLGEHEAPSKARLKEILANPQPEQKGHYQPLRSEKLLNYCWEPIYTFYKPPEPGYDRLSVGVPYTDLSNLTRGTRGKNGDLHCGGDVWFIPYKTTGAKTKKRHSHEFPEALVERCLRVSGIKPGGVVLDPFGGSGTTAVVAKRLGLDAIIVDRDDDALEETERRWIETIVE